MRQEHPGMTRRQHQAGVTCCRTSHCQIQQLEHTSVRISNFTRPQCWLTFSSPARSTTATAWIPIGAAAVLPKRVLNAGAHLLYSASQDLLSLNSHLFISCLLLIILLLSLIIFSSSCLLSIFD